MKRFFNFILKPLFHFGIIPKLAPTGMIQPMGAYIGEKAKHEVAEQLKGGDKNE